MRWITMLLSPQPDNEPTLIGRFVPGSGDRLRQARLAAGYLSVSAAAEALGMSASAYRNHEMGSPIMLSPQARTYAEAFGCDTTWLQYGDAPIVAAPRSEHLIFLYHTSPWISWMFLLAIPFSLAPALDRGDLSTAILPGAISLVLLAATLWLAIGWAGRIRPAEIWLDGNRLIVRRGHMFNRGEILHIPMAETRNWKLVVETYKHDAFETIEFDHEGTTYILQNTSARYADLDALQDWIDAWDAEAHAGGDRWQKRWSAAGD